MDRTAKSMKNVIYTVVVQGVTTLISFITRTALIKTLGIEAVSVNGLFTEVVAMLSLAEMGVGTAIVYNLYKPLAENDQPKIAQLMNLFKQAYHLIAVITLVIGLAVTPWIQMLVNGVGYTTAYIRVIYILFVLQTTVTYLFSYKTTLLNADQRKYIVSIITVTVKAIGMIVLVLILVLTHNYLAYLIANIFINLSINIVASYVVDREYPYIKKGGMLPASERKQVFSNIKNLFIRTLSGRITNSTDNILISTLVSTIQVGIYSNYALFFNVVKQMGNQLIGGITGSLGNMMAIEDSKHCERTLSRLTLLFFIAASLAGFGLYMCLPSVVEIWIGEGFLLDEASLLICCYVIFLEFSAKPLWEIMTVSGLFAKDKNISIAGSIANLVISVTLGSFSGLVGIFVGTICTYVIQIILKTRLLYRDKLGINSRPYYLMWGKMNFTSIIAFSALYLLRKNLVISNSWLAVIVYGLLACLAWLFVIWIFYSRTPEFKYLYSLLINQFLKKQNFLNSENKKES